MNIVVIKDSKPGHYNQSFAVAETLNQMGNGKILFMDVEIRSISKYILRFLLNGKITRVWLGKYFRKEWLRFFYKIEKQIKEKPDIVVSSGRDTSLLTALFGLIYGAKTLFIGNPKKLDPVLFTRVLTLLDLQLENQIVLDTVPSRSLNSTMETFCSTYKLDRKKIYYTLLIGGDGAGYQYNEEEYDMLTTFVNATAKSVNWLVTTSRRTPERLEAKMQREMQAAVFIAYNREPKKVVSDFLALSETIFATEESASMVSEGVGAQKRVVTLAPEIASPEKAYRQILEQLVEKKHICRYRISSLSNENIEACRCEPLPRTSEEELKEKLQWIFRK